MPEVEAVIDARGKLDPLSSDKLEIGAVLEVEIALKTSTEADATLELEVKAGLEMRDGNSAVLMLTVLILDRPDKVNITPDNAGPGSMVNASDVRSVTCGEEPDMELDATPEIDAALDPDKVDSVTGSVKEAAMLVCVLGGPFAPDDPFELSAAAVPDRRSAVDTEENAEASDMNVGVRDSPEKCSSDTLLDGRFELNADVGVETPIREL
ncbi:hypothetical protein E4U39_004676 [Claviceps sp. Clav50 group G5]|nr:hypothetical protein E4U39_004676 [Claviceps sp. Clav50 group G5]